VLTRRPTPVDEPTPPVPPMRAEIAEWIDTWCDDEGISRVPWWRRLFR
jgi:hypothetical protein